LTATELDKLESVEKAECAMYRDHRFRSGCALIAKNIQNAYWWVKEFFIFRNSLYNFHIKPDPISCCGELSILGGKI